MPATTQRGSAGRARPAAACAGRLRSGRNDQYLSRQKFAAAPAASSDQYAGDVPISGARTGNMATDSSKLASRATWNRSQRTRTGTSDSRGPPPPGDQGVPDEVELEREHRLHRVGHSRDHAQAEQGQQHLVTGDPNGCTHQ